jgi:hypothetical protein
MLPRHPDHLSIRSPHHLRTRFRPRLPRGETLWNSGVGMMEPEQGGDKLLK